MGILLWIVIGLFTGCIAKWIVPWAPGGIILTVLLGIGGAITGGMLGTAFGFGGMTGFDIRSLMIALGGAIILLTGYGLKVNRMTA
jgi:uncharacterized membrane protein YeaQ/YmgE (transglycosylase-associated protein family)